MQISSNILVSFLIILFTIQTSEAKNQKDLVSLAVFNKNYSMPKSQNVICKGELVFVRVSVQSTSCITNYNFISSNSPDLLPNSPNLDVLSDGSKQIDLSIDSSAFNEGAALITFTLNGDSCTNPTTASIYLDVRTFDTITIAVVSESICSQQATLTVSAEAMVGLATWSSLFLSQLEFVGTDINVSKNFLSNNQINVIVEDSNACIYEDELVFSELEFNLDFTIQNDGFCKNQEIDFINKSSFFNQQPNSIIWKVKDGKNFSRNFSANSLNAIQKIAFNNRGDENYESEIYTITLENIFENCVAKVTKSIILYELPVINCAQELLNNLSFCPEDMESYNYIEDKKISSNLASGSWSTYLNDRIDSDNSFIPNQLSAGNYVLKLEYTKNTCSTEKNILFTVNQSPKVNPNIVVERFNSFSCDNYQVSLNDQSQGNGSIQERIWQISGRKDIVKAQEVFNLSAGQNLAFTLIVTDTLGCSAEKTGNIVSPAALNTEPRLVIDENPCLDKDLIMRIENVCKITNRQYSYDVYVNDQLVEKFDNESFFLDADFIPNQTFSLVVKSSDSKFSKNFESEINADKKLNTDFSFQYQNLDNCLGNTLTLENLSDSPGDNVNYKWSLLKDGESFFTHENTEKQSISVFLPNDLSASSSDIQVYQIELQLSNNDCQASKIERINLFKVPNFQKAKNEIELICKTPDTNVIDILQAGYLKNIVAGDNVNWSLDIGDLNIDGTTLDTTLLQNGDYDLNISLSNQHCSFTDLIAIRLGTPPEIKLGDSIFFNEADGQLNLTLPNEDASQFEIQWSDNVPEAQTDLLNPTVALVQGEEFGVTVIDQQGCSSIVSTTIRLYGQEIYTSFSPNNDGINDVFDLRTLFDLFPQSEFKILNRLGEVIYESTIGDRSSMVWDPVATNNTPPFGVYFIHIRLNDEQNRVITQSLDLISSNNP